MAADRPPSNSPLLSIEGLNKAFSVPVLRNVNLTVLPGQVHALIGANGAGKTTLARIVTGLLSPDSGRMQLANRPFSPASKSEAERAGVHIVQQELNLIPSLSIAENLFLNQLNNRAGFIQRRVLHQRAVDALGAVGLQHIDPATLVSQLGVGHQQLIEIAAALAKRCRLLILDEPTAALTEPQVDQLFSHIDRLKADGVGIIYISHRMDEIRRIADHATILRDGQVVACDPVSAFSLEQIIHLMAGRAVEHESRHRQRTFGPIALRVEQLTRAPAVHEVSFQVRAGEILGIAGLVGSGRTELLRAVFGADRPDSGVVSLPASNAPTRRRFSSPRNAVRAGVAMIPEDRKNDGLLLRLSVRVNATLGRIANLTRPAGWIHRKAEHLAADRVADSMQINAHSLEQPIAELSGGNQQKTLIARWLLHDYPIMLFDEPTRGIDVATKARIYHLLNELADAGRALVVVSSDLTELIAICDRIAVMSAGRLVADFPRDQWSHDKIMSAAISGYLEQSLEPN